MKDLLNENIYEVPDGYFESLTDRIIHTRKVRARHVLLTRVASAAILLIGLFIVVLELPFVNDATLQAEMDQEVEFYINSGYWNAEDVISFSENPDELLDRIITEEWSSYSVTDDGDTLEYLEY